jgi:hypothetical protein
MRQLLYLSTEKLRDFHPHPQRGLTARVREIEASVPALVGARVTLDTDSSGAGTAGVQLDEVIAHLS